MRPTNSVQLAMYQLYSDDVAIATAVHIQIRVIP